MRSRRMHWCLMIGVLTPLLTGGCKDDTLQSCTVPQGRIQGVVRNGLGPVEATVRATLVGRAGELSRFEVPVAANGAYGLDLPAGRYTVGVRMRDYYYDVDYDYSAAGLRAGEAPPDTLLVEATNSPVHVDFHFASLQIRLDLTSELDGDRAGVFLQRPGPPMPSRFRSGLFQFDVEIRNGIADILARSIVPGTYKLEAVVPFRSSGEHFWFPGGTDSSSSFGVELGPDQIVAVDGGIGSTPARLQGRITGAWQEYGIEPPLLQLWAMDSTVVGTDWRVGADGGFDERILLPRPIKLAVGHQGILQWIGGTSFATASVYDLHPGETVSGIDLIESGARVELTVDSPGDVYVPTLRFHDAATMRLAAEWRPYYVSGSNILVPNLRPGTYRLYVDFPNHGYGQRAPQWYDRVSDPSQARILTIGEGQVVHIPIVAQVGATLVGNVLTSGRDTETMAIYVTPAEDRSEWCRVYSWDPDGRFVVSGLPNGRWKVGARLVDSLPESGTIWYPGTTSWNRAGVITIRDFERVTGISIQMRL